MVRAKKIHSNDKQQKENQYCIFYTYKRKLARNVKKQGENEEKRKKVSKNIKKNECGLVKSVIFAWKFLAFTHNTSNIC